MISNLHTTHIVSLNVAELQLDPHVVTSYGAKRTPTSALRLAPKCPRAAVEVERMTH